MGRSGDERVGSARSGRLRTLIAGTPCSAAIVVVLIGVAGGAFALSGTLNASSSRVAAIHREEAASSQIRAREQAPSRSAPAPGPGPITDVASAGTLDAISCPSAGLCLAAGQSAAHGGLIERSLDGGKTWQPGTLPAGTGPLHALSCPAVSLCVALASSEAFRSTTAGTSWRAVPLGSVLGAKAALEAISCPTVSTCIAVGAKSRITTGGTAGIVLTTRDGGESWSEGVLPVWIGGLASVACMSETTCVAVGADLVVTTDAGQSWVNRPVAGGIDGLTSVTCASESTCVALGPNPAAASAPAAPTSDALTTSGGTSWTRGSLPASSGSLWRIACSSRSDCVASGDPVVSNKAPPWFVTSDGGATWEPAAGPPGLASVAAIACPSSTSCVTVGSTGAGNPGVAVESGSSWATRALS